MVNMWKQGQRHFKVKMKQNRKAGKVREQSGVAITTVVITYNSGIVN